MAQTQVASKGRRRSSERVAAELLEAALVEFSTHGFEGASTRAIARRAGWHQPQINYHFQSKEQLWRASVDLLFAELADETGALDGGSADPVAMFLSGLERFVRFSSRRPELHRIIGLESATSSGRLEWIVQHHTSPLFAQITRSWTLVREAGAGRDLSPQAVWQLLVGLGARPFATAPEAELLVGTPLSAEAQVKLLVELLAL